MSWRARLATTERDYERLVTTDETKARAVSLGELKIVVDVRSFESVVYYLGEVVRTARGDSVANTPPYTVRVLGRQPSDPEHHSRYEETLFDLRRGSPDHTAALVVHDDAGNSNLIPAFCYVPSPPRP